MRRIFMVAAAALFCAATASAQTKERQHGAS
jgi:hypothetical protein